MPRLFVAIRPPSSVRDALIDAMDCGVDGARWQDEDQLHLTLRFIGHVDDRTADDLVTALAGVHAPAIDVTLAQIGLFDRRGRIATLWIGAHPHDALAALHRKINHAIVRAGLPPERRAFTPHVTLARFGRRGGNGGAWIAGHAGLAIPPFRATAFELIESQLSADGAAYDGIARFALRVPPST